MVQIMQLDIKLYTHIDTDKHGDIYDFKKPAGSIVTDICTNVFYIKLQVIETKETSIIFSIFTRSEVQRVH